MKSGKEPTDTKIEPLHAPAGFTLELVSRRFSDGSTHHGLRVSTVCNGYVVELCDDGSAAVSPSVQKFLDRARRESGN